MRILGVNAIFHDPAAALVVDGRVITAIEEERLSRRKHGKRPVAFAAWELPELAMRACLAAGGLRPSDLDAVAYSFDPELCEHGGPPGLDDPWDWLRMEYARRAPDFLATALPGLDPNKVVFVPHHRAHAASAFFAVPAPSSACLVLDGRGERASHLAGVFDGTTFHALAGQHLPHSLGLVYESLTEHLGFLRSSDEYKVMALASYGKPRFKAQIDDHLAADGRGGFVAEPLDWTRFAPARGAHDSIEAAHADLACSVQRRLEEVLVDLAGWLRRETGETTLTMAGGTALNCVANSVVAARAGFDHVWVQPAAGDAGTALGAAWHVSHERAGRPQPMRSAALGRSWSDDEIAAFLRSADVAFSTPRNVAAVAAATLADDGMVAWFQGASEYGPRALGHRSLLAHPGHVANLERLNLVKGREQFRPVAPMVLADRAAAIFDGPLPSPYMLFVHRVDEKWRDRIPAVTHVDGTARVQTVDEHDEPLIAQLLLEFERLTGLPVLVNTSLNTAGRPMVDSPRDALEVFAAAPIDLLVMGSHIVRRAKPNAAEDEA